MGKPVVRILAVTDDQAQGGFLEWTSKTPDRPFHMGEFLKVLLQTTWLGFDIEIIRAHQNPHDENETPQQFLNRTGADVIDFRFDQAFQVNGKSWVLADFDLVFFMPQLRPGTGFDEARRDAEAAAIIDFMEAGGGFFATGDHDELGSILPPLIPRVRSMRRWLSNGTPPAPDGYGSQRIDTTQSGHDQTFVFEDQSDDIGQDITLKWFGGGLLKRYPHPLLCSPAGAITVLPDHMHEGICDEPADLTTTFVHKGEVLAEYPLLDGQPLGPQVIATGHVIGGHDLPAFDGVHTETEPSITRDFGVICAWDGHRVERGRVVVESTWHHFFNINVSGDKHLIGNIQVAQDDQRIFGFYIPDGQGGRKPAPDYEMIQWYYRNLVYWLIPAHRTKTLWWSALADLYSHTPRLKEELSFAVNPRFDGRVSVEKLGLDEVGTFNRWRYYGQLAEDYLKLARGACGVSTARIEIYKIYKPKIPWWEWIQEEVDPWGPIARTRPEVERYRQLRSLGLAPRLDAALTAGLGLAVTLAASMRATQGAAPFDERSTRLLDEAWDTTVTALDKSFQGHLAAGLELGPRLLGEKAPIGRKT